MKDQSAAETPGDAGNTIRMLPPSSLAHSQPLPARIVELDALRGLAATVVVFHHMFFTFNREIRTVVAGPAYDLLDLVQAQNKAAVFLFFVLSGYSIGLATRSRPPVTWSNSLHYLLRRARRLIPLYWFSLAWTASLGVVYGLNHPSFRLETLVGNILFLQTSENDKGNWFVPYGINGPYWSLSYEVFFYLFLPITLIVLHRGPFATRPKTSLVAFGTVASVVGIALNQFAPSPFSNFLTLWVLWLLGYAAVQLKAGTASIALVIAPAVIFTLGSFLLATLYQPSSIMREVSEGTIIAAVFAVTALNPRWMSAAPFRWSRQVLVLVFGRLGDGSYALYLLHFPFLLALHAILDTPFGTWEWWLAGLVFVAFAIGFCPWLERSSIRITHRTAIRSEVQRSSDR